MKLVYVLTWTILFQTAFSWDTDDLELFDLVEEVNRNFYDVLGVPSVSDQLSISAICQRKDSSPLQSVLSRPRGKQSGPKTLKLFFETNL